jgi:hypothetical protein
MAEGPEGEPLMGQHSPTGYWAHLLVCTWIKGKLGIRYIDLAKPVLYWNDSGSPVIADEAGNLTTPAQYVCDAGDEVPSQADQTIQCSFEVQPYPREVTE